MKIGILGGTFDPPHNGHLLIANEVYHALGLDEIWFMPNALPPHKMDKEVGSATDREEMLRLAIAGQDHFRICLVELQREGPSYTYETMRQLCEDHRDHQFYFIIGGDMVEYLPKWYKIAELLRLVTFIGVTRPGYTLSSPYPIVPLAVPEFAVSSSLLRQRVRNGETTQYLLPDAVQTYIERNGLYGTRASISDCTSTDA